MLWMIVMWYMMCFWVSIYCVMCIYVVVCVYMCIYLNIISSQRTFRASVEKC
jgi:hypothetical protein